MHEDKRMISLQPKVCITNMYRTPNYNPFHQMVSCDPHISTEQCFKECMHVLYVRVLKRQTQRQKDKTLPLHVIWSKTLEVNWKRLASLSVALRWEEQAFALFWFTTSAFVPWTLCRQIPIIIPLIELGTCQNVIKVLPPSERWHACGRMRCG